jgi:hypothetical protein
MSLSGQGAPIGRTELGGWRPLTGAALCALGLVESGRARLSFPGLQCLFGLGRVHDANIAGASDMTCFRGLKITNLHARFTSSTLGLILLLGQCPCVATVTYNISIIYIYKYVLYNYEIEDDIRELSGLTSKRNSGL